LADGAMDGVVRVTQTPINANTSTQAARKPSRPRGLIA
jgi:hypothetical protein